MQRRKNKLLLRHEWVRNHYRLTGTQLALHTSAESEDTHALETIDVDDYFVSCSSTGRTGSGGGSGIGIGGGSNSRLAAALKALRISTGRGGGDGVGPAETPFAFQLVPASTSASASASGDKAVCSRFMAAAAAAANLNRETKKKTTTLQFAVAAKEERVDWMREVMLAKAMKQKGEGFQVTVNGRVV